MDDFKTKEQINPIVQIVIKLMSPQHPRSNATGPNGKITIIIQRYA